MSLFSWIGDLAGDIFGPLAESFTGNKARNRLQWELYKDNQRWMEKMANTAHQREVEDLRAAGLNPVLSAGGSGASTPQSTAPQMEAEGALPGLSAALDIASTVGQLDSVTASANAADAAADLDEAKTEQTRLNNISTALDTNIKLGVFDDLVNNNPNSGGSITRKGDALEITKPAQRRASAYVRSVLSRYEREGIDTSLKSSALDISRRNFESMPDGGDARFNQTWLPRMNTASNVLDDVTNSLYSGKLLKMLKQGKLKPSKKGWKKK